MKKFVHSFLDWWKDAPLYQSVWFIPLVMALYVFAALKNILLGDK